MLLILIMIRTDLCENQKQLVKRIIKHKVSENQNTTLKKKEAS